MDSNKRIIMECPPYGIIYIGTISKEYEDHYDVQLDTPWSDNPNNKYRYNIRIAKEDLNKTWFYE